MRARIAVALCLGTLSLGGLDAPARSAEDPVVRTLDNGLKVAVIRDARLPIVQIQALVPAGSAQESPRELGAATLVARLLTRGTASRSARAYAADVERLGGAVRASAGAEHATVSGAFRSDDLERGLELVADAMLSPIFADEEIDRVREGVAASLLGARDQPAWVADEHAWARVMRGHPYGHPPMGALETVAGFTRADLQKFHRECYRPDRALLAIAGDVEPEVAIAAVVEAFAGWGGRARPALPALPAERSGGPRILVVDAPGAEQAEIRIGLPGPALGAPESFALTIANDLLGGRPGSRLSPRSRGRQIDAHSQLHLLREGGLILLATVAHNDSVPARIASLLAELGRLASQPPSEDEVAASGRSLGRAFPVMNEALGARASQWLSAEVHGLGADYSSRYPERMQQVSAADVRAAAQWLDPGRSEVVVVGSAGVLRAGLEALGPVEVVPLAAAPVAAELAPAWRTAEPTAEELARGRRLARLAAQAHGGLSRLQRIKDSTLETEVTIYSGGRTLTGTQRELRKEPDRLRVENMFMEFASVQVLDGDRAWSKFSASPDSVRDEDSLAVGGLRAVLLGDPLHLLVAATDATSRVAYRGADEVRDRPADVVEVVSRRGDRWVLFLDAESHRLLGVDQNEGSPLLGPALRRLFGELRPVEGILWPHWEERLVGGERSMTLTVTSIRFNTGLGAEAFKKPVAESPGRPRR